MDERQVFTPAVRIHSRKFLLAVLCGLAISGCAHPVRPMLNDRMMVISGRSTAGEDRTDATRNMLVAAARLTLDHGFRYFAIVGLPAMSSPKGALSIQPGADLTIRVYRDGEVNPHSPGIWDAENIGAGALPDTAR